MSEYLLEVRNVNKSFGGVVTANDVCMSVEPGQIRGLIGPNGAGKTTLLNLISGIYDVDGGNIFFNGKDVTKLPTHVRAKMGIGRTFQSPRFMNRASIEDNLKVGTDLLNQFGYIQSFFGKKGHDFMKNLEELMEIAGFTFDWQDQITSLPYGQQKLLEIVRAMLAQPKLILVDEPAAGLNKQEQERASQLLFHAVKKGVGVVLIEHSMDMVMSICDRITVLRNGELVGAYAVAELPRVELISKMIGKELGDIQSMGKNTALCGDEVLIEADGLSAFGRIQDFDLQIHRGEVVGFAGLLGSGRTETAELLAGVAKPEQGALRMNGREVHFNSPLDAMHHKIAFCPEDRKIQGIIGDLSVRENIIIGLQAKKGMWNHIPLKEQERIADEYIKLLQIKVSSPEQLIRNLSGGNQQKAIIARWLVTQPDPG